jgi:tRNA (guanosine-2'-O-)-methyltransferase
MLPRRFQRLRQVLDHRQPDLTVLMENVHKPHNLSAILRTCDAVGVADVHAVAPTGHMPTFNTTAQGSQKWVDLHLHDSIAGAITHLKAQGFRIYGTHLSREAIDYTSVDYTQPSAILLGAERWGISDQAVALVDQHILIPMVGMVQSLNVSVAAATILFEAQRQRLQAGLYDQPRLDPETYRQRLFEWAYPDLANVYRREALPYPALTAEGEIRVSGAPRQTAANQG